LLNLTPDEWTAIELSLRISIVATALALPFGIALGWLLARKDFWGKTLLDGIVYLPLVLPPVVTGYLLLISFGRRGPIGAFLDEHCLFLPLDRRGAGVRRHGFSAHGASDQAGA
jgi:molybdate transport system permease protein